MLKAGITMELKYTRPVQQDLLVLMELKMVYALL